MEPLVSRGSRGKHPRVKAKSIGSGWWWRLWCPCPAEVMILLCCLPSMILGFAASCIASKPGSPTLQEVLWAVQFSIGCLSVSPPPPLLSQHLSLSLSLCLALCWLCSLQTWFSKRCNELSSFLPPSSTEVWFTIRRTLLKFIVEWYFDKCIQVFNQYHQI